MSENCQPTERVSVWVHPHQARSIRALPDFSNIYGPDKKIGEYHGIDIHETTTVPAHPEDLPPSRLSPEQVVTALKAEGF